MTAPRLSALVVARNEAAQLAHCLETLRFADEIVVVLDRTTDRSRAIAEGFGARVIEGAWEIEGARRNAGIDACTGEWIVEVDADERVPPALADEITATIAKAPPGHFLIPFDNYIGGRLVRHGWGGAWGVAATARLFARGHKRWGPERVHPAVSLSGARGRLSTPMVHLVDRDVSDMLHRLDRYTTLRAQDLRERGAAGSLPDNVRRFFSRFLKCYVMRRGYREGRLGFAIALFAGLYPLIAHLKATLDEEDPCSEG